MKPTLFTVILKIFLVLIILVTTGCSQNQVVQKPNVGTVMGTRISLVPPADFTPSTQFPGYQLESLGSSIMITELPGPFAESSAGFSKPTELVKRGMSLLDKQDIKSNGHNGLLVKVEQSAYGTDFLKWLLIFGDEKETVLITATFPKQFESELSEKMKASILTATWDRKKDISPIEGLNFTVDEMGELKLAKRVTNMLIYTKSSIFPSKDLDDPLFIAGQSISKVAIADPEEFAKSRINQIKSIKDSEIEQSNKVTIDSLNGYEIVATGKDQASGKPMLVYQVMLFEEESYFLIQGLVSNEKRQSNVEVFKQMARTFKRKKL